MKKVFSAILASLLVLAAIPMTVSAADELPEPIAYYNFDNDDFIGADVTGNGHNATVYGDVALENGKYGKAGAFNGENSFINVKTDLTLPQISFSAWVNLNSLKYDYNALFATDMWNRSGSLHYNILPSGYLSGGSVESSFDVQDAQTEITFGEWTHIVVAVDTEAGNFNYYINGEFDQLGEGSPFSPINLEAFSIGGLNDGGSNPTRFIDGLIDDFRIYDVVLTEEQALAIYEGAGVVEGKGATTGAQTVVLLPGVNYPSAESNSFYPMLSGSLIGSEAYGDDENGCGKQYAFDGDPNTIFAPKEETFTNAGIALSAKVYLKQVNILPRKDWANRLEGVFVQGSDDGEKWVNIVQITGFKEGEWKKVGISGVAAFKMFRVTNGDSTIPTDLAEVVFYGTNDSFKYPCSGIGGEGELLTGTIIGTPGWSDDEATYGKPNAFDGNPNTPFAPYDEAGTWGGIQMETPYNLKNMNILGRGQWTYRLEGAKVEGSNDGENWTELGVITDIVEGEWKTLSFDSADAYTMFRVANTMEDEGTNIAEVEFYGVNTAPGVGLEVLEVLPEGETGEIEAKSVYPCSGIGGEGELLTGTIIGTPGWSDDEAAYGKQNAFDGNSDTPFGPYDEAGTWGGIQTEAPYNLKNMNILGRGQWTYRLEGAKVEGSNDGENWTELGVITDIVEGEWKTLSFDSADAYTMFRVANTMEDEGTNIAEVEFYGVKAETKAEAEPEITEAPQTFDDVGFAAVFSILSLLGFTVAKKQSAVDR